MLLLNWLGRLVPRHVGWRVRQPASDRPRERRLKLMRLEQRRVLNADFSFNPGASLSLSHVDGQLSVREVSTHVEFDLTGSVWQDTGSSGLTVDNSVPNHSILSVEKADLETLMNGISIHAADPAYQLTLDTQANAIDLHSMAGPLIIQDFGDVHQLGVNEFRTNDVSIDAQHSVSFENSSVDDLTLVANDSIALNGTIAADSATLTASHGFISGSGSLAASVVDLHTETGIYGSTVDDALSISATSVSAVNSGAVGVKLSNATLLDASVTALTTEGGDLEFSQQGGSVTFNGDVRSGHVSGGDITLLSTGELTIADSDNSVSSGSGTQGTLSLHDATIHRAIHAGDGDILIQGNILDGDGDLLITGNLSATGSIELSAHRDILIESTVTAAGATSDLTITADSDSDGFGGFWLDEHDDARDARLSADRDITVVGSSLLATSGSADSLRIDADSTAQQVVAGRDLTLIGSIGFDVSTASDVVIDGRQTAIEGSLTVISHEQILLGADQTAGTDLLLQGEVRVTDDVSLLAGGDVIFGRTVDDDGSDATGSALTVQAVDEVIFVDAVGSNTGDRLDTLTITNAGSVDFLNSVTVDGDIRVTTTAGGTTPEGRVNFHGAVTTTAGFATGSVEITNDGLLTISSTADFVLAGSFTQNGAGTTELGADITTSNGSVFFRQAVLLTDEVTIDASNGGGDITFLGTIDSEETDGLAEHNSLTLSSGSGTISFLADIGAGTLGDQTLGNLTIISANQVIFGSGEFGGSDDSQPPLEKIALDGALDVGVGGNVITDGIVLNAGAFPLQLTTTDDSVRLNGAVTLASSVDINTNATGEGGNVTFTSSATIDSEFVEFNDLTIDAGLHRVVFNNDLGGSQSLGSLTITQADAGVVFGETDSNLGPGTTGPVTKIIADGPINIGVDSNVIISGIVLNGGISTLLIATTDDSIRFNGGVTLSSSVDINSRNNTEGDGGTVTFTSSATIDSQDGECNELTIDAGTQQVLFNGNIGAGVFGDQRLGSLIITQADSGVIFGESDVDLGPGTTGPVTAILTCGPIDIGVGGNVVGGTGVVFNAGDQTLHIATIDASVRFNGAVTLSSDLDIDTNATEDTGGGTVTFTSAASIDSEFGEANDLIIDAGTQQVLFNNDLGAIQSLGSLIITQADAGVRFGQAELEGEADLGQIPFEVGLVTVIATEGPIDIGVGSHLIDGGIVLNGGSDTLVLTTTDDTVRFNGFVTLASDVSISTNATPNTGGATVTFTQAAAIDSQLDEEFEPIDEHNDLTIDAGTQQVLFNNDIGAVQSLGALTITQADAGVIFGQSDADLGPGTTGPVSKIITDEAIDIGVDDHVIEGAGIVLNAGSGTLLLSTTDDSVRFNGAVRLATSLDINTNATGIGGSVTFTEAASIDSQTGEFSDLTIDAGTEQVLFNNNLGESQSLGTFTIEQADGGVIFGQDDTKQGPGTTGPVSIITTDGPIDIGVGGKVIEGGIVFNAGDGTLLITTNSDQPPLEPDEPPLPELPRPVRFNGAVTLVSDVEIKTTADGFGSLVDPLDPDHTTFIGGRTVIFTNAATIDSGPLGEAKSLTIDAGTQQVLFNNDLGATDALGALTIIQADRGVIFGETDTVEDPGTTGPVRIIATDGAIDIGVGANTINQPVDPTDSSSAIVGIVLNAGDETLLITTTDDSVRFNGPVTLASNVDLNTNTGGIGGTVTFTSAATIDSDAVNDEHNDLIIDAGTEFALFNNNIGATQSLGQFIITQADEGVFFGQSDVDEGPGTIGPVNTILTEGTIDIGVGSNVILGGIQLNGGLTPDYELNPVLIQSSADIRFNGLMTSQVEPLDMDGNPIDLPAVDLTINAGAGLTLTGIAFDGDGNELPDGGGILTDDYNVVINGDTDDDAVGDLNMGANTVINSNDGYIDARAANAFLGELLSTNTNPVDTSDPVTGTAPAIRVVATFGAIIDNNDDFADGEPVGILNIQANNRDFFEAAYADLESLLTATAETLTVNSFAATLEPFSIIQIEDEQMRVLAISDDMLTLAVERGVNGTAAADHDGSVGPIAIIAFQQDPGAGVVLDAVLGIGSLNAIETDIASLSAVNHDLDGATGTASGNIEIVDIGGAAVVDRDNTAIAFHHIVDLLLVQNQADPLVSGDTDNGVIDINVEFGDLRIIDDGSALLHDEFDDASNFGIAVPTVQSENTIRITADTIMILDDVRAVQDPAGANSGDEFFETIELNARADFYLAVNRVITTDENYAGSLAVFDEDLDHDGRLDVDEDANGNGTLDVDEGEDVDGDGRLDVDEDANGNGVLDPSPKPKTFADDTHVDVIHIVADFDAPPTADPFIPPGLNGPPDGKVLLALGSTISTDSGIEQQIAPRPEKLPSIAQRFIYTSDSAFFSGEIFASNLDTVALIGSEAIYLGTLTFTIGVPGEQNLVLDIDWGDLTPLYQDNVLAPAPPLEPGDPFVFNATVDQHATRFLIPVGGVQYNIPHEYTQKALNMQDEFGNPVAQPGRVKPSDPMQVRFAVSQHPSILVEGQSVLNPNGLGGPYVPLNAPYDDPTVPPVLVHEGLYNLTSTDVSDNPEAFLPRVDNGVVAFVIPTTRFSLPLNREPITAPPDPPRATSLPSSIVTPPQLTTETVRGAAVSASVTTDEYFELRRVNEDGAIEFKERLTGDYDGELLLSNKETFETFIRERGDGDYEIWFITKDTREGALIERPVIQFRLESGHLAPPSDEALKTFKPLKLIPVPGSPNPEDSMEDDSGSDEANEQSDSSNLDGDAQDNTSVNNSKNEDFSANVQDASEKPMVLDQPRDDDDSVTANENEDLSSSVAPLAAGAMVFASTRRWKRRSKLSGLGPFSKAARLTRKLVATRGRSMNEEVP